jgi:hypothetical protein
MYAPVEEIGRQIRCPDCHTLNLIKPAKPSNQAARSGFTGRLGPGISPADRAADAPWDDEYRLQDSDRPWTSVTDATVPVVCEVCQTRMYAREDRIGEYITCPDCGRLNRVPDVDRSAAALRSAAPSEPPRTSPAVNLFREQATELLQKADEEIDRYERTLPDVPDRPMLEGIYSYLWQRDLLVLWASTTGLVLLIEFILLFMLNHSDPRRLLPGLLILVVAVPVMLGFLATQLVAIIYNSAEGHNSIVHAPENHFVEWTADVWLILCGLAYACFPGYLLYNLEVDLPIAVGIGCASVYLLFPIMILSMLEAGSRFLPFSGPIWQSMSRHPGAWLLFYLQTAAMMGITAAAAWVAIEGTGSAMRVLAAVAGSVAGAATLLLYFRLLGRLVLTCGTLDQENERTQAARSDPAIAEALTDAAPPAESDLLLP